MPTDLRAALSQCFGTRFRVERELGRGGMATVYLVHDAKHGRDVALKLLRSELAISLGRDRFLQEMTFAGRLTHPNILPLYESGVAGESLFYLMPYVEGETLRERLAREHPLQLGDSLRIARDVASALAYAHARNIVHRDIKPSNILLESGAAVVADFGIARAITRAADDVTLTDTGLMLGTPAYMSPEQAAGDPRTDGRSDIYSLGCVLYEMLAGGPPFAGTSGRVILARHSLDPVPPLLTARPDVPVEVERVVLKALAKSPADRYGSASELAAALEALITSLSPTYGSARQRRPRRSRHPAIAIGGAILLGGSLWAGSRALDRGTSMAPAPALDTTAYAVLPIEHEGEAGRGVDFDQLLRDALAEWHGIRVLDETAVRDAMPRGNSRRLTGTAARRIAASLRAGRYVRADVSETVDDGIRLHAGLYDTGTNTLLADSTVVLQAGAAPDSVLSRLGGRLAVRGEPHDFPGELEDGSRSVPARQAFRRGLAAMERWDLARADTAFAAAAVHDSRFAGAFLWLALERSWDRRPVTEWRWAADRAAAARRRLPPGDADIAAALAARGRGDMAEACRSWKRLTTSRPDEFAVWYGSGDCQHSDEAVIRDSRARTGWRFRSSYQTALEAYQHAFRLLPSTLGGLDEGAFEALRRLLVTSGTQLRFGRAVAPDTNLFAAYPAWRGDTLAYEPSPVLDVMESRPGAVPELRSLEAAVRHQRALLFDVATSWATAFPRSSGALEALAVALQLLGDPSALDTLLRARSLAETPEQRLYLGATEVFMRLRRAIPTDEAGIRRARQLADSLLADTAVARAHARTLLPLAALTGRARLALRLAQAAGANPVAVAKPLRELAFPMLLLSALGGPADTLAALERNFAAALAREVAPDDQPEARRVWLARAATLAYPAFRFASIASLDDVGDPLATAIAAFSRGDTALVRRLMAAAGRGHQLAPAFDQSVDGLYPEAWLLLQLGDRQSAAARLDPTLLALRQAGPELLQDPVPAAALVRAMALRAQIAALGGDRRTAARWARAVVILWADADRGLQPVVETARELSR